MLRFLTLALLCLVGLRAGEPLKIAYSDWPGWTAWEIAIQKGWLKEAGVNAEFVCVAVLGINDAPLPGPRTREMNGLPDYRATRDRIEALIHPPQHAAAERLPMIKLTQAGDEVL